MYQHIWRLSRSFQVALSLLLAVVPNFFLDPCCCVAHATCCCITEDPGQAANHAGLEQSCCQSNADSCCSDDEQPLCEDDQRDSTKGCEDCRNRLRIEPFEPRITCVPFPVSTSASLFRPEGASAIIGRSLVDPLTPQRRHALLEVWIE